MVRILALALTLSMTLFAATHVEKDPQLVVEPDQTDIFAIPLDEDAQDQEEELNELEHPAKSK